MGYYELRNGSLPPPPIPTQAANGGDTMNGANE